MSADQKTTRRASFVASPLGKMLATLSMAPAKGQELKAKSQELKAKSQELKAKSRFRAIPRDYGAYGDPRYF